MSTTITITMELNNHEVTELVKHPDGDLAEQLTDIHVQRFKEAIHQLDSGINVRIDKT